MGIFSNAKKLDEVVRIVDRHNKALVELSSQFNEVRKRADLAFCVEMNYLKSKIRVLEVELDRMKTVNECIAELLLPKAEWKSEDDTGCESSCDDSCIEK